MFSADIKESVDKARDELDKQVEHLNHCLTTKISFGSLQEDINGHTDDFLKRLARSKGISLDELKDNVLKAKQKLSTASLLRDKINTRTNRDRKSDSPLSSVSSYIKIMLLLAKAIDECWDLFSLESRVELKKYACFIIQKTSEIDELIARSITEFKKIISLIYKAEANLKKDQNIKPVSEQNKTGELEDQAQEVLDKINEIHKATTRYYELEKKLLVRMKEAGLRFTNSVFGAVEWINCQNQFGRELLKTRQKGIASGETKLILSLEEFDQVCVAISGEPMD